MDIALAALTLLAPLFFYVLIVLPLRLETKIVIGIAVLVLVIVVPTGYFLLNGT